MVRNPLGFLFLSSGTGALLLPQTPLFSRLNSPQPLFLVEEMALQSSDRVHVCVVARRASRGTRL